MYPTPPAKAICKKTEIVGNADGQRKRRKAICILIRKDAATQTFAVTKKTSNHGK